MGEAGFEPAKAEPPDLQSGPFGRSGIPPPVNHDSNHSTTTMDGGRTALAVFESRGTVATSKSNVK